MEFIDNYGLGRPLFTQIILDSNRNSFNKFLLRELDAPGIIPMTTGMIIPVKEGKF